MKETKNTAEADALIESIRTQIQSRKGKAQDDSVGGRDSAVLRRAAATLDHLKGKAQSVRKWPRPLRFLRRNQQAINEQISKALENVVAENWHLRGALSTLEARISELGEKAALMHDQLSSFSGKAAQIDHVLHLIESQFRPAAASVPAAEIAGHLQDVQIDAFYLAFENQFRGNRELIKERLQSYLPHLSAVKERVPGAAAVDIGCGRGEWLEILKENGISGHGVDMNARMAAHCQSLGLSAEQGDGIAYLQSLPTNSQAVISAFHVVEHLPLPLLLELFRQSFRVLRPGGIAIFETPNPECAKVASYTFFFDPTHRNPIPPELLAFLGTHAGFGNVKIERLVPFYEETVLKGYLDYGGVFEKQ